MGPGGRQAAGPSFCLQADPCRHRNRRYGSLRKEEIMRAMRSARHLIAVLLGMMALASCSTMSVKANYNPATPFAKYQTYAWLPNRDKGQTADLMRGSPTEQRLQSDVDRSLAAKGITRAAPGQQPDFLIAYHVVSQEKLNVEDWGYGGGWAGWGLGGPDVYSYRQGTLILDFVDPQTRQAFWRGYASDVMGEPGTAAAQVDKAVTKMLAKYPPSPKVATGY